ncbi:MAG: DUF5615 family PIN-like protein [Bacteroidia bacterium]
MPKILIDNNISVLAKNMLSEKFKGTMHVFELGLERATDTEIWNYAETHFDAILSRDKDFYYRAVLKGYPPKFIWLAVGNCSNFHLLQILKENLKNIDEFLSGNKVVLTIK